MTFYETLIIAMEHTGLKFSDLCDRTGFYPSYFSNLKKGIAKDVTWERALAIIHALDMTPDEFAALQRSTEEVAQ